MRSLVLILGVAVAFANGSDIFVRPQGCPGDIRLIVDDSYRELVNQTLDRCAAQCIGDGTWCRSISYFDDPANTTKVCTLNLGHSDSVWTGLRYAKFWSYYERISPETGFQNFGIANITTCQPNTYRDCRTAFLATNIASHRQIWLKLDNNSYAQPAQCHNGQDIMMMQRTGAGFYDISWNRPWEEYRWGFGRDVRNFWFGLDNMYKIVNQDVIIRWNNGRCLFPRKLNGTTTRMTLSDQLQGRCPWWSLREEGRIVLSLRSLCICEDTVNAGGIGHIQLCGCNEPGRFPFVWSPTLGMIVSRRPSGGSRCLRISADAGGEEVIVTDCNQYDSWQTWTLLAGRYRNYWGGWDLWNRFYESSAVRTQMKDEAWNYQINADPIFSCGCLWCKVQKWYGFSTYDRDRDGEGAYNMALRQAGGDWLTIYGWGDGGEPKLTSQKDASKFNFCGNWLTQGYMTLQADDWYY